jgi:hypothetical protein
LFIKYIKSVIWRVAKCLSYIEEARCLKVKDLYGGANPLLFSHKQFGYSSTINIPFGTANRLTGEAKLGSHPTPAHYLPLTLNKWFTKHVHITVTNVRTATAAIA